MKIVYFLYFLLKSDYRQVWNGLRCLRGKHNLGFLLFDSVFCSLRFGTSLDDYFSFRFFSKSNKDRSEFATTAYMYVFHKSLNDRKYKLLIDNKSQFRIHFKQFSGTSEVFLENDKASFVHWLNSEGIRDFVIKDPLGTLGKAVSFLSYDKNKNNYCLQNMEISLEDLFKKFSSNGELYVEPRIKQHPEINRISPSALNTIRVITVLRKDGAVDIISAAFRISVNSETDNFSTGNLAAAIDISTGIVITPGIRRMAACSDSYEFHPVTGEKILGFKIPHWNQVISIVRNAAKIIPQVRTVGWDVAILEEKAIIIEGNPSWNKGAPQIPLDKGIRPILDRYLGNQGL